MRRLPSLPRSTLIASNSRATGTSPAIAGAQRRDISDCGAGASWPDAFAASIISSTSMAGVSLSSVAAVSTLSATATGAGTEGGSMRRSSRDMNEDERSKIIWSLPLSKSPLKRARLSETMPAMRSSMHCWLTRL